MQALENHYLQFVNDALMDRQPVKFTQDQLIWSDYLVYVVTQAAAF